MRHYTHGPDALVWCGAEGFLTFIELAERTRRDIEAYAKMQPLRFRSAMLPRDARGARIWCRRKPKITTIQPTHTPHEKEDQEEKAPVPQDAHQE